MKIIAIYSITHIESGRRYVGSTCDYTARVYQHRSALRRGKHRNSRLQNAWRAHGPEAFEFTVLEELADSSNLIAREQFWLDASRPDVYNFGDAADCPVRGLRRQFAPEHLANLAAANKARAGWKHSDAAKDAVSRANSGRVRSEAHREAIRAAQRGYTNMRGRKRSPEAIEKSRLANLGSKRSPEARANLRAGRLRYLARIKAEAA